MSATEPTIETLLRTHAVHAPERLRARVLALDPAPRRRPRRLALLVVPAALALAVAAALVHGALRSGTQPPQAAHVAAAPERAATGPAAGDAATRARAAAPSVTSSRLVHTDASLQLRVADRDAMSRATSRATQIAVSLGGYAQSVDYRAPNGGGGAAYVELRVPATNVKTALARLGALGTIVSQRLSVTDLQAKLETQSAQIEQLRRRVAALRAALRDSSLPDAQAVLLRIRLNEAKRALAQRLHARKGTLTAGTTARISLVVGTERALAPVAHRGRLGRMLDSAVGFLALEGIVALYALIVVSPIALAAWLVWLWRRRSTDRLLSDTRI